MAIPLTKKEAARRLGVSVRTIERRIGAGKLPTTVVHGPHGPEVRVYLDATPDVAGATPDSDTSLATVAAVEGVAALTEAPATLDNNTIRAIVLAWKEVQDENRAWARRYDTLAAEVESLRRPLWRRIADRLRRRG